MCTQSPSLEGQRGLGPGRQVADSLTSAVCSLAEKPAQSLHEKGKPENGGVIEGLAGENLHAGQK